jgi:hypothetical protein
MLNLAQPLEFNLHERANLDERPIAAPVHDITDLRRNHEPAGIGLAGIRAFVCGCDRLFAQWSGDLQAEEEPVFS